jgi:hypothetical protein
MRGRALLVLSLMLLAGRARAEDDADTLRRAAREAAQVTRDGSFLPTTLSARIGDQRVIALSQGGYDTAPGQGAAFSTIVEGAIVNRVAIRAGIEYVPSLEQVSPSAGLRVGILRQERQGVDLAVAAQYKNLGFSEASGEFEFLVMVARRWNRLALFANLAYGQGLDEGERDAEARVAFLYAVHPRVNVGLDARARLDLGEEDAAREEKQLNSQFDFLGGPLVTVAVSHVMFMLQTGAHALVQNETAHAGFAALAGVGTSF